MSDIQTTDWLTFTPANAVGKRRAYIDLPVFSVTGLTWKGASEVVLQYNFSASSNFVLTNIPVKPTTANYGLCIRFRVGSTTYRYKLWRDNNFVLNDAGAPLYSGQVILKNFVLEVWSFNGETTADNAAVYRVITGVRTVRSNLRDSADYALAVGTAFSNLSVSDVTGELDPAGTLWYRWFAGDMPDGVLITDWTTNANALHGFTLSNTGGTDQPIKVAATSDALQGYVTFDGSDDYVQADSGNFFPIADEFTIYAVIRNVAISGTKYIFQIGPDTGSVANYYYLTQTDATVPNGMSFRGRFSQALPLNTWGIVRCTFSSTVTTIRVASGAINSSTTGAHQDNLVKFTMGARADKAFFANVDVADLLCYNTLPTEAQDAAIMAYLNDLHFGSKSFILPATFNSGSAWLDNP